MAFKSSKFNIVPKGNFSGTYKEYAANILTNLKTAFINTNTGWSLQSDIERIGTNTSDNNGGNLTLQLKSSASNEYLRIWVFTDSNYPVAYFVTTNTASGDYNHLNLHVNNVFRYNYSGVSAVLGPTQSIYFGVSDNPIDADFGNDLGLKCPLFGIANYRSSGISNTIQLDDYRSGYLSNEGATITVITDGKMFGVMKLKPNSAAPSCFYAPDMFICANSSDTKQAGVICSNGGGNNFYLGSNSGSDINVTPLFCKADGTFDFSDMSTVDIKPEKKAIQASASSNKLVCGPIVVYTMVGTYAGSTFTGVTSGIGIKGWINTDYIRNTDCNALPYASRGLKYVSGRWLCIDAGTLICWDDSNSSPFEAAT